MMKFIVLAAVLAVATATPIGEVQIQGQFVQFMKEHSKQYPADEVFARYNIFKANVAKIEAHNALETSYTMGLNEFADLTADEFKATYYGYTPRDMDYLRGLNTADLVEAKTTGSLDWRTKGAVTPVKNQGQCGSCWAFSTTGSTEGANQISTGTLTSLSEQQLVDCAGSAGNQGCNGGLMDNAFNWIISNGGLCTESDYPYTGTDGTCATTCTPAVKISSYKDVTKTEASLGPAVDIGPVSIAIEADQSGFQFYKGGVFSGPCGTQLDHGVLLAGYGTDSGKDYWLVKNSWGASWGESGYIRLVQGQNQCGISNAASYPVV